MPEYLAYRCCMCPNEQTSLVKCPGIDGTPHPIASLCRFVKYYQDERGWLYFVRSGIGGNVFKAFYLKPGKSSAHACKQLPWHDNFDQAQSDLNALAKKKNWMEADRS